MTFRGGSNIRKEQISDEIKSQTIVIEEVFKKLKGSNKELVIIPNVVHCDLYDNMEKIHFDKIERFIKDI